MPESAISPPNTDTVYRRTLGVVMAAQVFSGLGLAAGATVGALLVEHMLGTSAYAGLPVAIFTAGSALTVYTMGRVTSSVGRRPAMVIGFGVGAVGAVGVVAGATAGSVVAVLFSMFLYGAGTAANLQARYAATDLARPEQRGYAVSRALLASTVGAVAGPNMVSSLGHLAGEMGLPRLAGPFVLSAAAFGVAATILGTLLRPDPYLAAENARIRDADADATAPPTRTTAVIAAACVMVIPQAVMVAIMTMTPVHMNMANFTLVDIGRVIGAHIAGMFLPSLVTGPLVDRWGRTPMAWAGAVTLTLAGVLSATAPSDSLALITLALVLLGVGWNIGLVTGTAMLVDATHPGNRARIQGTCDVAMALAGATAGVMSGVIMSHTSYATLSICGAIAAIGLLPIAALGAHMRTKYRAPVVAQ